MNASTDWISAAAILGAGLVLGLLLIFAMRRRKSTTNDQAAELAAKRDALVAQLRELDDVGITDSEERTRLELETADVLRALDRCDTAVEKPRTPRPMLKGFALGVACTLAVGFIGYLVMANSTPKPSVAQASMPAAPPSPEIPDANLQQLEQAVQNDPDDIEQRIALAKAYFAKDDLMGTFEQTKAALAKNPEEPRALTYNAIVRMAMGQIDQARTMLETATKTDPKYLDAWVALASVHMQAGDAKAAAAAIDKAIEQHPQDEARLRDVLAKIQANATTPAAGAPVENPELPPGHPPMPSSGPEAAASPVIRITLAVSTPAPQGGIVYIIARPEGEAGGHPIAVKRVDAASFPITLDLGSADSMMGQPLPAKVHLEARLDSDGDAATKNAGDPHASADGVIAGGAVALTMK